MTTTKINNTRDLLQEMLKEHKRTLQVFYILQEENTKLKERERLGADIPNLRPYIKVEAELGSLIHRYEHSIQDLKKSWRLRKIDKRDR